MTQSDLIQIQCAKVNSGVARAMIRMAAMQAANSQFPSLQPYSEQAFLAVIDEEGIDWNGVISTLQAG